jgi:hypothetical protein
MGKFVSKTPAKYDESYRLESSGGAAWSGFLYLVGIGLCFTGVGAFIGGPLIVMVFINQIKGGDEHRGAWVGSCPKCRKNIYWYSANKETKQGSFCCPSCNVSLTFYDGTFRHEAPSDS